MSLYIPQESVTISAASLVWTPVVGATSYRVYCNGRPYKTVNGCELGVRGLLHDRTYEFEVRALLGRVEMPCGAAKVVTRTSPQEFDAARYGVDSTGQRDSTAALQAAIDACTPGGSVYLAAGRYRVAGVVRLKSDLNLYMEPRTVLVGTTLVGSGLHDMILMGGVWENTDLILQNCRRVCLRDIATNNAVHLESCRHITLDNAGTPVQETCRGISVL